MGFDNRIARVLFSHYEEQWLSLRRGDLFFLLFSSTARLPYLTSLVRNDGEKGEMGCAPFRDNSIERSLCCHSNLGTAVVWQCL